MWQSLTNRTGDADLGRRMGAGSLDFRDRNGLFDALEGASFDVLVIGGGVTGAGVARDCAMRGLSVALVEARDFASGTSSRSSKMIHGGLRYLAQGDLVLVREAASERKIVQRIAPHLARRTPFVIPAKSAGTVAKLRAGLWAFEKLGGVPKGQSHKVWSQAQLRAEEPAVNAGDLSGAVVYPEFLTDDSKLTIANIRSAKAYGAVVASYARVVEILIENGRAVGVVVEDALKLPSPLRGGAGGGGVSFQPAHIEPTPPPPAPSPQGGGGSRILAKVIINAAGPWVDAVRSLENPGAPSQLKLTKGVHVVVPSKRLPVTRTVIISTPDKRSIFAVPRGGSTYIGTTDTFYPHAEDWPRIEAADIDYLLDAAAARFTSPRLTHADVTAAWSGVRPLVAEEGKSESQISRKDEIWTGPGGVLSIAGGKLTAYRRMAERIADMAEEALGRKPAPSRTANEPLVGGDLDLDATGRALRAGGQSDLDADRLVSLYGAEAADIAAAGAGPAVEARHAVLHEGALTLEDYWYRRSARACFDPDGGMAALAPAAREMAALLGWSEPETRRQVEACKRIRTDSMAAIRPDTKGLTP